MPKFTSFILLVLFLPLLASCTRNDDQREFEQEAYQDPKNITKISSCTQQEPEEVDEDDWRISPLFQGSLVFRNPPCPNPFNLSETLEIDIDIYASQSIVLSEIVIAVRNFEGRPVPIIWEETHGDDLYTFSIQPEELDENDNPDGAVGLHRIYIYNGRDQLISYGDVEVVR